MFVKQIIFPKEHSDVILKSVKTLNVNDADNLNELECTSSQTNDLHFRVSVIVPVNFLKRLLFLLVAYELCTSRSFSRYQGHF